MRHARIGRETDVMLQLSSGQNAGSKWGLAHTSTQ
jgi:hypothetical protein